MVKDIGLALRDASQVDIDLQFAKKAQKYYQDVADKGIYEINMKL